MAPQCKHEICDNNMVIDEIVGNASSSSLSSTQRRARFSLNMEETVVLIASHQDYSLEEFEQCFYTPSEQGKMRSEQLGTIARMEKGKKAKKDDYRGLESQEIVRAFDKKRSKCLMAVLMKQAEHGKLNIKNPDSLANISQRITSESTKKALLAAQQDAEEAEEAWTVQPQQRRKSLPKRMLSKLLIRSNSRRG
eukprot:CAMPEP_0113608580 /NCGR_PEP_ID=MMETSP0017_2-20120614/4010_1 /TAXON_ID=2856 /ORGANISM="Cylindrotheca closterium" /LENGTH=193 /DNA_ID=CAMNT_0000517293 /DNA_START=58 /DNA_END=639 /DNA_ORIENTATION=- /assembly_acc=CAM_ASM_000147